MSFGPADIEERRAVEAYRRVAERDGLFAPHCELVFESLEELGSGGMASVLRVRDRRLGREAALKLLGDPDELDARERFVREGRLLARLDHPAIPPVYEMGHGPGNRPYILMRVVEGRTLRALLTEREPDEDPRPLLEVLLRVADALAYAHARGVIHRDIKPENIMVEDYNAVFVVDWGLARELSSPEPEVFAARRDAPTESGLTVEGTVMGTPGYMAPEQASGRPADPGADVFALGSILTEILTGKRAVEGRDVLTRIANTIKGRARSPRELRSSVPEALDELARRSLSLDPADRLRHAGAFRRELGRLLAAPPRGKPWWVILFRLVAAALVAAALTAFGLLAYQRGQSEEKERAQAAREKRLIEQKYEQCLFLYQVAVRDYRAGRFEEACQALDLVLKVDRKNAGAYCLRGAAYQQLGRLGEARVDFNAAIDFGEDAVEPFINRAFLSYQEESYEAARRDFEKALAIEPENALALKGLGDLEAASERWRAALDRYTEAIARNPKYAEAYYFRSFALEGDGRPREAIEDLSSAIDLAPRESRYLARRGELRLRADDLVGAIEDYGRARVLEPGNPQIHFNLIGIHVHRGDFALAAEALRKAEELELTEGEDYLSRGLLYRQMNSAEKALADLRRAVELSPELEARVRPEIDRLSAMLEGR